MKPIVKKVFVCMISVLFLAQMTSGSVYFVSDASSSAGKNGGAVKNQGSQATLLDENFDNKNIKTIYSIDDYEDNNVLVMYRDGSLKLLKCGTREKLKSELSRLAKDGKVEAYQPNFDYSSDTVYTEAADMPAGAGSQKGVQDSQKPVFYGARGSESAMQAQIKKKADVNISASHPEHPSDPYYSLQWALNNDGSFTGAREKVSARADIDINAPEAWSGYRAKRNVTVALIDTGVNYNDAEISGSMWVNSGEIPNNGVDDDGNGYIDDVHGWNFFNNNNVMYSGSSDDHGTHCAGSMAAASNGWLISGIMGYGNIKVMNVKALGGMKGKGTTLTVMRAMKYAEQNGAKICNLSLGTDVNDYMLYKTMRDSDMLFVTAAGNSESMYERGRNIDQHPCYPASYTLDNVISVANINAAGDLHYTSNYGMQSVDLAAPGSDIIGIMAGGRIGYMTGTSMAAPMVSAAAAMIYTGSYTRTLSDTAKIIKGSVKPVTSLSYTTSTGGMLDLAAALRWK